jgi:DNA-binding response OmpR family regulator
MPKILIVDDDPDIVEASTLFLQGAGYEVVSASNRADGMAMTKDANPDLLILDVMMDSPDDGIVMAQDLRRQGFDKPILMLTSVSRATGMTYGQDNDLVPVDAFIEKPVKPSTLVEQVQKLLSKAGKKE